jgi:hypothetical protein
MDFCCDFIAEFRALEPALNPTRGKEYLDRKNPQPKGTGTKATMADSIERE